MKENSLKKGNKWSQEMPQKPSLVGTECLLGKGREVLLRTTWDKTWQQQASVGTWKHRQCPTPKSEGFLLCCCMR